ncbi:MAG: hypothetical protein MZV63_04515 [Marinilabiliales bacterium]|nr:hypothetical protein [Marinilabiliales bacterium]
MAGIAAADAADGGLLGAAALFSAASVRWLLIAGSLCCCESGLPGRSCQVPGLFWLSCGFSSINCLLVKDLIYKILFFEESLLFLILSCFCYFPQFGNKHFAQFKNIMHILR